MAVVVSTFYTGPSDSWASGATASGLLATDSAFKVNTALTNWIAAINNPDWIRKYSTSDPITYGSIPLSPPSSLPVCWWDLVLNEGETKQYGLQFMRRPRVGNYTSSTYYSFEQFVAIADYGISPTAEPEGVQSDIYTAADWDFDSTATHLVAYEGSGTTPWFCYAYKKGSSQVTDVAILLARASKSNIVPGTYYPGSGISQWVAWSLSEGKYMFSQDKYGAPSYYGTDVALGHATIPVPARTGFLFNIHGLQGSSHLFGQISDNILVSAAAMGAFGDTITIRDIDYTCLPCSNRCFWIKTGE